VKTELETPQVELLDKYYKYRLEQIGDLLGDGDGGGFFESKE